MSCRYICLKFLLLLHFQIPGSAFRRFELDERLHIVRDITKLRVIFFSNCGLFLRVPEFEKRLGIAKYVTNDRFGCLAVFFQC